MPFKLEVCQVKKTLLFTFIIFFFLVSNTYSGAPSRTHTYTSGAIINPTHVTVNEDNLYQYLQGGVDTIKADTVTTSHIDDGTIATADIANSAITSALILNGAIVNADVNASAAIPYSKLSFSNNIVAGDIATNAVTTTEIASGTIVAEDIAAQSITSDRLVTVAISDGGTSATTQQAAIDNLLPSQAGKSGQFLTTDATNSSWGAATNTSNVIFSWSGIENYADNGYGVYVGSTQYVAQAGGQPTGYMYFVNWSTTYRTFLNFKFTKIAGIDTVTIHARIAIDAAGTSAEVNVDIGGANNNVTTTSNTFAWATAADVDVSGLTDGTTYNGVVQLKETGGGSPEAYCSAVTLIGS